MTRLGMDVDVVDSVGKQLKQRGGSLQQVIQTVDGLINRAGQDWWGRKGQQFVHEWRSVHRPALAQAAAAVTELSETALRNVAEQRRASAPGQPTLGGTPPWLTSFGSQGGTTSLDGTPITPARSNNLPFRFDLTTGEITGLDGKPLALPSWDLRAPGHTGFEKDGTFDLGWISGDGNVKAFDYQAGTHGGVTVGLDGVDAAGVAAASAMLFAGQGSLQGRGWRLDGEAKAGASGEVSGRAHVGPDGASVQGHVEAMVGLQASASGEFDGPAGSSAHVGATGIIGVGVEGNAKADVGWEDTTVKVQLKGALIVGAGVSVEVHVEPEKALNELGRFAGNDQFGSDVRSTVESVQRDVNSTANSAANAMYHGAQEISSQAQDAVDQIVNWKPPWA